MDKTDWFYSCVSKPTSILVSKWKEVPCSRKVHRRVCPRWVAEMGRATMHGGDGKIPRQVTETCTDLSSEASYMLGFSAVCLPVSGSLNPLSESVTNFYLQMRW